MTATSAPSARPFENRRFYRFTSKRVPNFSTRCPEELSFSPVSPCEPVAQQKLHQPFHSSLIDTVKIRLKVKLKPLAALAETNPNLRQNGTVFLLTSPETGAGARLFSRSCEDMLYLEFSPAKWLTGQNIVGSHDLRKQCSVALRSIFKALRHKRSATELRAAIRAQYTLTRVDVASHVDCGSPERTAALMTAIRNLLVGTAKDVSFYDSETMYIGQHSRRRSLKIYRKDIETEKRGLPECVKYRSFLLRSVKNLVRIELSLRRDELADCGLDKPSAWQDDTISGLITPWIDKILCVEGQVPNVRNMGDLNTTLQLKLNSWLRGDTEAFTRGVGKATTRTNRRDVMRTTGIDVFSYLTPDQRNVFLTNLRSIFLDGHGFRDCHHKLIDMSAHATRKRE